MPVLAPPHPISVFRVLKQAWREWIAAGNASTLTIVTPPSQPAANLLHVTGTCFTDPSLGSPQPVRGQLTQAGTLKYEMTVPVSAAGAITCDFPAGVVPAGSTVITFSIPFAPSVSATVALT